MRKNRQWEQRYRTIDGNNVYGGRSALAYAPGKNIDLRPQPARALTFPISKSCRRKWRSATS